MVTYYKIYSKSRDKYLNGTPMYNNWTVDGRLFPSIGKLRSFITSSIKISGTRTYLTNHDFNDWEIREFKLELLNCKELVAVVKPELIVKLLKA